MIKKCEARHWRLPLGRFPLVKNSGTQTRSAPTCGGTNCEDQPEPIRSCSVPGPFFLLTVIQRGWILALFLSIRLARVR